MRPQKQLTQSQLVSSGLDTTNLFMLIISKLRLPTRLENHQCTRHLATPIPTSQIPTSATLSHGRILKWSRRRFRKQTQHAPRGLCPGHSPAQLQVEPIKTLASSSPLSSCSSELFLTSSSLRRTHRSRKRFLEPLPTRIMLTRPPIASILPATMILPRLQLERALLRAASTI